jgi:hypothetical protein
MDFSGAQSERELEDCIGPICLMLNDFLIRLAAARCGRRPYWCDISWGGPEQKRA